MEEQGKFCADCGEQINQKAEICPKCGVRQIHRKKKGIGPAIIIIAVVVGIGLFGVIGIISAIAIPQFSSYRQKAYESAAKSDLKNLKTTLESYYADNQRYPKSLDQINYQPSQNVSVEYAPVDKGYVITSRHMESGKEYRALSESTWIEERTLPDGEFIQVK